LIDLLKYRNSPPTSFDANPTPGAPPVGSVQSVELPSALREDGTRRKVLVPGCGKGYDVVLFASWGYDAVGLEVSQHAARQASEYFKNAGEGALEGEYNVKDEKIGRGSATCVVGDYFEDGWLNEAGAGVGGFDIIYDNTVCASMSSRGFCRPKCRC
jgi:SAM-dependent methyltransferase